MSKVKITASTEFYIQRYLRPSVPGLGTGHAQSHQAHVLRSIGCFYYCNKPYQVKIVIFSSLRVVMQGYYLAASEYGARSGIKWIGQISRIIWSRTEGKKKE